MNFFQFSFTFRLNFPANRVERHEKSENHTNILTTSCETHYHINSDSTRRCDERDGWKNEGKNLSFELMMGCLRYAFKSDEEEKKKKSSEKWKNISKKYQRITFEMKFEEKETSVKSSMTTFICHSENISIDFNTKNIPITFQHVEMKATQMLTTSMHDYDQNEGCFLSLPMTRRIPTSIQQKRYFNNLPNKRTRIFESLLIKRKIFFKMKNDT